MKIKRVVTVCLFSLCTLFAYGQEYLYELGVSGGISHYVGDLSESGFYNKIGETYGALWRYNHNFRSAIKVSLSKGTIAGSIASSNNQFPEGTRSSFKSDLIDFSAMYEFNFFHYSDKFNYLGTKRLSPYITAGIGVVGAIGSGSVVAPVIPFGLGLKYKLKNRLNVGAEFTMRWALTDQLDGIKDPLMIESEGLKNNDWYAYTMIFITYEFGKRRKICNSLLGQ